MEQKPPKELPVKNGKLPANFDDMSIDEIRAWERNMQQEAREYLFSIGQPLVYLKDGQMIAEYADGSIEPIR
ncbi:MAG: hypothetical protein ACHQHN_04420 [Sphingobacteriales bacterium]